VLAEHFLIPPRGLAGLDGLTRADLPRDLAVETAGEHDEAVGMLREQLAVHARLVVEALEVRLGHELDQVLVPGVIPDQDGQMVGAFVAAVLGATLLPASRRDVELAPEDRLDRRFLRREIEIDAAEEVAVVGERERLETEVLRLLDQLLNLRGAVEEAVLGVDVEMHEVGCGHSHRQASFTPTRSSQAASTRCRRPPDSPPPPR